MPFRTAVKVTNPHSWQGRIGATRYPSSKQCLWLLLGMLAVIGAAFSQTYEGKKILYINSYHVGYEGSDPITQGIEAVLKKYPIELQIIYMDTKRNPAEDFSQAAALKAKAVICLLYTSRCV